MLAKEPTTASTSPPLSPVTSARQRVHRLILPPNSDRCSVPIYLSSKNPIPRHIMCSFCTSQEQNTAALSTCSRSSLFTISPTVIASPSESPPLLQTTFPRRNCTTSYAHYQRETYQLVRVGHTKLQLLDATQPGRGVTEVLRGHAQG